jgi:hypothetical protein
MLWRKRLGSIWELEMSAPMATILIGILSAAVTMTGWIVLHYLARRKEIEARAAVDSRADRLKRLELNLEHLERQISEFYGPIHSLIYQVWATWEIKQKLRPVLDDETYVRVDHYFGQQYFSELHTRIRDILREKAYLVDGGTIPRSFYEYMKHSMMEHMQIDLWETKQISTSKAEGYRWPPQFADDVERGLTDALRRRQALLAELGSSDGAD